MGARAAMESTVCITRRTSFAQISVALPTFLVVLLGFTLFGIESLDIGSRLEVLMALVICAVTLLGSVKSLCRGDLPGDLP